MAEQKSYPDVGAPDPELENSPIADDTLEESEDLKQELLVRLAEAEGCDT